MLIWIVSCTPSISMLVDQLGHSNSSHHTPHLTPPHTMHHRNIYLDAPPDFTALGQFSSNLKQLSVSSHHQHSSSQISIRLSNIGRVLSSHSFVLLFSKKNGGLCSTVSSNILIYLPSFQLIFKILKLSGQILHQPFWAFCFWISNHSPLASAFLKSNLMHHVVIFINWSDSSP